MSLQHQGFAHNEAKRTGSKAHTLNLPSCIYQGCVAQPAWSDSIEQKRTAENKWKTDIRSAMILAHGIYIYGEPLHCCTIFKYSHFLSHTHSTDTICPPPLDPLLYLGKEGWLLKRLITVPDRLYASNGGDILKKYQKVKM